MSESKIKNDKENKTNSNPIPNHLETEQPIIENNKEEQSKNPPKKNSLLYDQKDIIPFASSKLLYILLILPLEEALQI